MINLSSFFTFTCIFTFIFSQGYAQSPVDSLLNELHKADSDTNRVKIYMKLAEINYNKIDSAAQYANTAMALAEKVKSKEWIANNYIPAMAPLLKAIGNAYLFNSLDSAMNFYIKSITLFKSINDSVGFYRVKINLANAYAKMNRLHEAIAVSKESVDYFKRNKDLQRLGTACVNIGIYYQWLGDFKNAEYYVQKSIGYNREKRDSAGVAYGQNTLADIYFADKKFEQAKLFYQKVVKTAIQLDNGRLLHMSYGGLAAIALNEKKWDDAIKFKKFSWGYSDKDYDKRSEMNNFLSEAYYQKGKYKEAMDYYKKYIADRDSFANNDRLKKADELEAEYQNKEKQTQINLLNVQNSNHEKQKSLTYIIGGLVLLLILIGFLSFRKQQKLKSQVDKQQAIIDERQRISRDLHDDLGAQLSTAKMFLSSIKNNPDLSNNTAMLENSLNLIDTTIGDLKRIMDDLQSSILQDKGYIAATEELVSKINQLQQINFSLTHYNTEKRLDRKIEHSLFRITQELINNSLKYARAKNVSINLVKHESKIVLMYEDDGTGFNIAEVKKGNGLFNIEARCQQAGGHVEFDSEPGAGARAVVEMPLAIAY